ncbi:Cytochrome P450 monooxygenase CLM2 [Drechslerella dactyloides]|uniref:Cytochrome P450 monooxygenase CLM2 n=1 Tax=Drechslerella dactyloides TaxID=74499 RepID=A0AAD6IWS8_DREDA|nr:Cytochrome P450 monooxygenase CLM2 [Drechslerella dactyloides]
MRFFFLAMKLHPEVKEKATDEIDHIITKDRPRLPTLEDRANMPYITALLKETLRWMPIAPLSLPHAVDREIEFRGYRIPESAVLLPSIGCFSLDSSVYPNPTLFDPERFLSPNPELSPETFVFGFGKRICPGIHLAEASLFLAIAQSLAVFDIKKPNDAISGKAIDPVLNSTPGIVTYPIDYLCDITPRSEKHRQLVLAVDKEHPWDERNAKFIQGINTKNV